MSTTNPLNPFWSEYFINELESCGAVISEKEFLKKSLKEELTNKPEPFEIFHKYLDKGNTLGIKICLDKANKDKINQVLKKYNVFKCDTHPSDQTFICT